MQRRICEIEVSNKIKDSNALNENRSQIDMCAMETERLNNLSIAPSWIELC